MARLRQGVSMLDNFMQGLFILGVFIFGVSKAFFILLLLLAVANVRSSVRILKLQLWAWKAEVWTRID